MKLRDLLTNLTYTCSGDLDTEVSDLVYDSRKAGPGKAFVCLSGTRADGHSYAEQAVQAGCCAVIAEHEVETPGAPLVLVENTRARRFYEKMGRRLSGPEQSFSFGGKEIWECRYERELL